VEGDAVIPALGFVDDMSMTNTHELWSYTRTEKKNVLNCCFYIKK
jgi:hypothetical protein